MLFRVEVLTVAGSRSITSPAIVHRCLERLPEEALGASLVLHGAAGATRAGAPRPGKKPSVDLLAGAWFLERGYRVEPCPAAWGDLTGPGADIRTNAWGERYDHNAGYRRNMAMIDRSDALFSIEDWRSGPGTPGTNHGIEYAISQSKPVFYVKVLPHHLHFEPFLWDGREGWDEALSEVWATA
jgi:hypothetical protein